MTKTFCIAALAGVLAVSAAACSSGPGTIASHGTVTVDYTSAADGGAGDDLSGGSQVVVVNSAGTVVGNGTLAVKSSGPGLDNIGSEDVFTFSVTVPGGLPRYGIQVGGTGHGTVWESAAQMKSGPALTIDETTGAL